MQAAPRICRDRLAISLRERAAYWKQRGKCRAIREGDANTGFFHIYMPVQTNAYAKTKIRGIEVNGLTVTAHDAKAAALTSHLRALLEVQPAVHAIDMNHSYEGFQHVNQEQLIAPFTEEEAKAASCVQYQLTGTAHQGLMVSALDSKAAWEEIDTTVMRFANAFHDGTADLERP
jgi:hypothetical protein